MRFPVALCSALLCMLSAAGVASASVTIRGNVSAQDTLQPLAGVVISVYNRCDIEFGCQGHVTVTSGTDGSYSVADVPAGYTFVAATFPADGPNFADDYVLLPAPDGQTLTVDFALAPGATIAGTVHRQSDGLPAANVPIALVTAEPISNTYLFTVANTATAADGSYKFRQLHANSYVVRTANFGSNPYQDQFYPGHEETPPSSGQQAAEILVMSAGQTVNGIDFSLVVGGRIVGTLTDRYTGTPLANASGIEFNLYDTTGADCCIAWDGRVVPTDAQGRFELDGLPSSPFYLDAGNISPWYSFSYVGCSPDPCTSVTNATILTVAPGSSQTIDLSLYPGAVITGTVTRRSDGRPIANALVAYTDDFSFPYATTRTDAQGHYVLTGEIFFTGRVAVWSAYQDGIAYIDQVYSNTNCEQGVCNGLGKEILPVEFHLTDNIDFELETGVTISGQVVRKDTQAGIPARVFLFAADGSRAPLRTTESDGSFRTSGLQAGTYYLAAAPTNGTDLVCAFFGGSICNCNLFVTCNPTRTNGAQAIVVGTTDVSGIAIELPTDAVFRNGFE